MGRETHEPCLSVQCGDDAAASLNEIRHRRGGIEMDARHDLDLRRRELGMKPVIVSEKGKEPSGDRARRMGAVDQQ